MCVVRGPTDTKTHFPKEQKANTTKLRHHRDIIPQLAKLAWCFGHSCGRAKGGYTQRLLVHCNQGRVYSRVCKFKRYGQYRTYECKWCCQSCFRFKVLQPKSCFENKGLLPKSCLGPPSVCLKLELYSNIGSRRPFGLGPWAMLCSTLLCSAIGPDALP